MFLVRSIVIFNKLIESSTDFNDKTKKPVVSESVYLSRSLHNYSLREILVNLFLLKLEKKSLHSRIGPNASTFPQFSIFFLLNSKIWETVTEFNELLKSEKKNR